MKNSILLLINLKNGKQKHIHTYDESGKMICCSLEGKINVNR